MTMAYEIKKAAYESDLKGRAVNVLTYLCDRSDNKSLTCFPSLNTIAKCLHIGISTVKRALADLVEAGFVKKDPRFSARKNGAQTSNLYTLAIPEKPAKEEIPNTDLPTATAEEATYQPKFVTFADIFEKAKANGSPEDSVSEVEAMPQEVQEVEIKECAYTIPVPVPTVPNPEPREVVTDTTSSVPPRPLSMMTMAVTKVGEVISNFVTPSVHEVPCESNYLPSVALSTTPLIEQQTTVYSSLPKDFDRYLEDPSIRSFSDLALELEWGRDDY